MEKIKPGDCVQLKHAGANIKMVVDLVFIYSGQERATCKWYNIKDGKFEELSISTDALKHCDNKD